MGEQVIPYQSRVDKAISQNNHEIIYLSHSSLFICQKNLSVCLFFMHFIYNLVKKFVKNDTFSNFLLIIMNIDNLCILNMVFLIWIIKNQNFSFFEFSFY